MITMIMCLAGMIFYTICGYYGMDKWLAGSGIAMSAALAVLSMLYDIKNEIVKAIKKGGSL